MAYPFNIRAYALIIRENHVLVTDEFRMNQEMTKFPGGGLEFGEGLVDCVRREIREEIGLEALEVKHFYTTDFFVASAFDAKAQVISVYYRVELESEDLHKIRISSDKYAWGQGPEDGAQLFRWLPINSLLKEELTFPIDQQVAQLLASNLGS